MDAGNIISIIVALIAGGAAVASQRAAARASTMNTNTTSRVDMEKDAYERARAFDTETIKRQDAEILELRQDNRDLHGKVAEARTKAEQCQQETRELRQDNMRLRERIVELERERPHSPHS